MNRFRYRQVFLFLLVLCLPTAAIIGLIERNVEQEQKNAEYEREKAIKQQDDLRRRRASEIGKDVFAQLDRIKVQEIEHAPATAVSQPAVYSNPAVVFVGW